MKMTKTALWMMLALSLCIPAHGGAHEEHGPVGDIAGDAFAEKLGEAGGLGKGGSADAYG